MNRASVIYPFEFYVINQSFATENGKLICLSSCVHQCAIVLFEHPWQHIERIFDFINLGGLFLHSHLYLVHQLHIVVMAIPILFKVFEHILVVLPQLEYGTIVRLNEILVAQMNAWPLLEVKLVAEDFALDQVGDRDAHLHDFHEVLFK